VEVTWIAGKCDFGQRSTVCSRTDEEVK